MFLTLAIYKTWRFYLVRSLEIHLRRHLHFHGVLTNSSFYSTTGKLQGGYSTRIYTTICGTYHKNNGKQKSCRKPQS